MALLKTKPKYLVYTGLLFTLIIMLIDLLRISGYEVNNSLPEERIHTEVYDIYYELVNTNENIDWKRLDTTLEYINKQYDVSDFFCFCLNKNFIRVP